MAAILPGLHDPKKILALQLHTDVQRIVSIPHTASLVSWHFGEAPQHAEFPERVWAICP